MGRKWHGRGGERDAGSTGGGRWRGAWDLEYVRTRNVWLDLKIIFATLKCVALRRGAF